MKTVFLKISNTTKKKARELFKPKIVNTASMLLDNNNLGLIESEFILDSDNKELKNCLLFMINRTMKYQKK